MMFRVLGPVEVDGDDGPVTLPGSRPRTLLTALLLQPGSVVSSDRLVDAVWGDEPPDGASNALQQVVARLRARLGPLAPLLRTAPGGGYSLSVPDGALDAELFEALTRESRTRADRDARQAAELLDRALALWRGTAYAELADGYAQPASVRLDELRTTALEDRAALHLAVGEYAEAVAASRRLLALDPLRERPVDVLMRALHADGRTPEALAVFREHRTRLADELGLDPSTDLRALESRILRGDLVPAPAPGPAASAADLPTLPWRTADLLGREDDVRLLRDCLPERRLVTLVGPGGVGKTRLALEVAHLLRDDTDPVWWADVTTVPGHLLVDALAEACGTEMPRGADPVGELAGSLRRLPTGTLVVDNAESSLSDLAPVVERLVATVPGLRVLATSRERLAVAGEHVHVLGPLALPSRPDRDNPAVRLFLERAHGLEPAQLDEEDLVAVSQLVRQLDGLPLAIELGAARAATLGIAQLARLVGSELDLLSGGRRTAAARHRTLRAVVDASYAVLAPAEATLLARLSVFPAAFDLDRARAVCADSTLSATTVAVALTAPGRAVPAAGRGRPVLAAGDAAHLRRGAAPRRRAGAVAGGARQGRRLPVACPRLAARPRHRAGGGRDRGEDEPRPAPGVGPRGAPRPGPGGRAGRRDLRLRLRPPAARPAGVGAGGGGVGHRPPASAPGPGHGRHGCLGRR